MKTSLLKYNQKTDTYTTVEVEVLETVIYENKTFYFHKSVYGNPTYYEFSYIFCGDLWSDGNYRHSQDDSFTFAKKIVFGDKLEKIPKRLADLELQLKYIKIDDV